MKVCLMLSLSCNYKCEYCYLQGNKTKDVVNSLKTKDEHTAQEWFDGLAWLNENWEEIDSIDISGGEPFLYSHSIELIKMLTDKIGGINVTTNLALLPDDFFSLNPLSIGLTVSAHLDENGKLRKDFVEKMIKLRARGFDYNINFVAYPKQIKKYDNILKIAKTLNRSCHLEPYIDYNSDFTNFGVFDNQYDEQYFRDNSYGKELVALKMAKERGTDLIKCYVSQKYFMIAENGDIFPCMGMMLKNRECIGNIFRREINENSKRYKTEPISCDIFCACAVNYRDGIR